jgi:4-hydroxy-tetrahydrodipicolinate synthase
MDAGLTGVLPVIATPFRDDWRIDDDALGHEIDWLFANGAHGVAVAMVSEIQRLSTAERIALHARVVELTAGRGPVVASVGGESTAVAREYAAAAADAGASAVMAAPPLLTGVGAAELERYLDAIFDVVPCPVILQDASAYVGEPVAATTQAELVARFGPERLLLKPEAPPLGAGVSRILEASGGTARIFDGSGGLALMDTHLRGIVGTMPGPDLTWAIRALWDALEAGDRERALDITVLVSTLISMVPGLDGYVAFEKHLLVRQGVIPSDRMRGPVAFSLDDVTRELVDRLVERLAAVVAG